MGGCVRVRTRVLTATIGVVLCAAFPPAAPARTLGPSIDLAGRFQADPLADPAWEFAGAWAWDARRADIVSATGGDASAFWLLGDHFTGTLTVRLKLIAGRGRLAPRARLVFARDPETGSYRYVELQAGTRGRVVLGQVGAIRGGDTGTFRRRSRALARGRYETVSLTVDANGRVTVRHGRFRVFRAAAGQLAPGQIGVVALDSRVAIDRVTFRALPDGEPCLECHSGQPDQGLAPDVGTYWDGSWWRANRGGAAGTQYGGHGDAGGKAAVACAGTGGCHDLRQPDPADHRNGRLEGRGEPTANSFHLRGAFFPAQVANPWDVQVAFDRNCYLGCHKGRSVPFHSHELDGTPVRGAMVLGTHMTVADGRSAGVLVDSDLTTRAAGGQPDFAPCVACHDPHGTGTDRGERKSNRMLRFRWDLNSSELCKRCHR